MELNIDFTLRITIDVLIALPVPNLASVPELSRIIDIAIRGHEKSDQAGNLNADQCYWAHLAHLWHFPRQL